MVDYQPLNTAKNEIRLLYSKKELQDSNGLISSMDTLATKGQKPLQLEMRTVSLDAYTKKSREFIDASGHKNYSFAEYAFPDSDPFPTLGSTATERASFIQKRKDKLKDLCLQADFGRWIWGDYMTLSYTWGDRSNALPIMINGQSMEITANLNDFLHQYFLADRNDAGRERNGIWIDAICINQNDIEERNEQVKRMGDIYSRASGSMLWLGKAAGDSDKALDLADSVTQHLFMTREEMIGYMQSIRQNSSVTSASWRAFCNLLSRPYWTRLWAIQEIALSQETLHVMCGSSGIPWFLLLNVINTFGHDIDGLYKEVCKAYEGLSEPDYKGTEVGDFFDAFNRVQQLQSFKDAVAGSRVHVDLKRLLAISRGSEQTDPRDKVYGIMGLVDERLSNLISPDYKLSTPEVFQNFAQAAIRSSGSLDILTCQGEPAPKRMLPSWVPDLTEELAVDEMTLNIPYRASRDLIAEVSFRDRQLIARGVIVDVIDGLGVSDHNSGEQVLQPVYFSTAYEGQAGIRDAIWRTLFLNRDALGDVVPESYGRILEVPWAEDEDDPGPEDVFRLIFNIRRRCNSELRIGEQDLKSYFPSKSKEESINPGWSPASNPFHRMNSVAMGRRLITTAKGYLGQAREKAQRGDLICILLGCSVPVVLRPHTEDNLYQLIGESYVHGMMDGEAMDWVDEGRYSLEDLTIC